MPSIFVSHFHIVSQAIGLFVGCLVPFHLLGQDLAKAQEPHPWLMDVPPALARLVDIGKVKIVEDQHAVEAAGRTALTVFSFSLAYRMRYRMNELSKDDQGKPRVHIAVSFFDVEVSPSHRILLSKDYRPNKPWESTLLQHEFDHVAISCDPRMLQMLRSLEGKRSTLVVTPEEASRPSEAWANAEIEKSTKTFQRSIENLVQAYYVRLDDASSHGLRVIDDRKRFFTQLYSVEDLEKMHFAYVDDVRKLVDQVDSEVIMQHYRLP